MQLNDPEILGGELLHPMDKPFAFFERLRQSILQATVIRGAVAFWTVGPDDVSAEFVRRLAAPGGFLCVDLHLPTSVDQLARLEHRLRLVHPDGDHLFLHLRKAEGTTEPYGANRGMPENLLHTKALLFDFPDEYAEIWIGSHNWTRRALVGVNIEASLVLRVKQTSGLYMRTRSFLEAIRRECSHFDLRLVEYYRWLQGISQTVPVLVLEGQDAGTLVQTELKLFGTERQDIGQFRQVRRNIYLQVVELRTQKSYLYKADVVTISDSPADIQRLASGLFRERQRYVIRRGRYLPRLELPPEARDQYPSDANYCATVAVREMYSEAVEILSPLANERWSEADIDITEQLRDVIWHESLPVSLEYATAAREIIEKLKIRLPALQNQNSFVENRATLQSEEPEGPLFRRKIIQFPK